MSRLVLFLPLLAAIATTLETPTAHARGLTIIDSVKQDFANPDCAKTSSCDLKSFSVLVENYGVYLPEYKDSSYGTRMFASYATDSLSHLENYGIAQMIRGCQYTSYFENGKVTEVLDVDRHYYNHLIPYIHPHWMIDGLVADPLDWGDDPAAPSRFLYYQWSPTGKGVKDPNAKYVIERTPNRSMLFVTDHPGAVYADSTMANDISLEFQTCVYRAAEVPKSVAPDDVNFARPLKCFSWSSSWVYDFAAKKYLHPEGISPICWTAR